MHVKTYVKKIKNTKIIIKEANWTFHVLELTGNFIRNIIKPTALPETHNVVRVLTYPSCLTISSAMTSYTVVFMNKLCYESSQNVC